MASRKKRMAFKDYEEAIRKTEELAASGDQESEDFRAAVEAATQFFLSDNGCRYFNPDIENPEPSGQEPIIHKWPTVKDLCLPDKPKHGEKHALVENRDVFVERQNVEDRAELDELDQQIRH